MNELVTIATITMQVTNEKKRNLDKYIQYIDQASESGAKLIVFPEKSLQGIVSNLNDREQVEYYYQNAEPVPGESTNLLLEKANEKTIYIVFGLTELVSTPALPLLFNSAVLLGPEGLVGIFRKVHLVGDEIQIFQSGSSWPVYQTSNGLVGMLICFDVVFPEATRVLTLNGAELLIMPTAWPKQYSRGYDLMTRVRAMENHRWFISSGQIGSCGQSETEYYGHSRIIDPAGRVIAEAAEEGMIVASINVKETIRRHQSNIAYYALSRRAPATYKTLIQPICPEKGEKQSE